MTNVLTLPLQASAPSKLLPQGRRQRPKQTRHTVFCIISQGAAVSQGKLRESSHRSGHSFQISRLYSATERSEEKYPALAMLQSIFFAQAKRSS